MLDIDAQLECLANQCLGALACGHKGRIQRVGSVFGLWDARENVYYRGEATPENVSRLLPIMLPVEELVVVLCGSAPILPGRPLEVGVQDRFVLLTVGEGAVGQRLGLGEGAAVEWSRVTFNEE